MVVTSAAPMMKRKREETVRKVLTNCLYVSANRASLPEININKIGGGEEERHRVKDKTRKRRKREEGFSTSCFPGEPVPIVLIAWADPNQGCS